MAGQQTLTRADLCEAVHDEVGLSRQECSTLVERTLELIFAQPVSGNVHWADIEALFRELGAEIYERVTRPGPPC